MHAAERPWMARPVSSRGRAALPVARMIRTDPRMPSPLPTKAMRTRPMRSARPPMKTMKRPEKSAVTETARFIWSRLTSGLATLSMGAPLMSVRMLRATVPTVPANIQKVRTPRTIPVRSRSLSLNPSAVVAGCVLVVMTRPPFRGRPRSRRRWPRYPRQASAGSPARSTASGWGGTAVRERIRRRPSSCKGSRRRPGSG